MISEDVLKRLCAIMPKVHDHLQQATGISYAHDCFCSDVYVYFAFSEEVLAFIEEAVREKMAKS